jgi:hypothetical protein
MMTPMMLMVAVVMMMLRMMAMTTTMMLTMLTGRKDQLPHGRGSLLVSMGRPPSAARRSTSPPSCSRATPTAPRSTGEMAPDHHHLLITLR